ncbi:MAG: LysR family transcriptional regulator [Alphaproteobacteria bacterium]|jgi:DNA-binding transcriptional LysR family regulator|nr:LysR family transcriptional regulator [Rhodospirillaceae bacterium]MDP6405600.1 LysR family transcriptional regulator [Alphaproteobacteria bacterium]
MDIELARTFLEISESGTFSAAAQRLNVTQSTVSMRIKALERELGRPLFLRGRGGITLTAAGEQFRRFATTLVRVWRRARQEVALPPQYHTILTVGGQHSLWQRLLLRWTGWMRDNAAEVALQAEIGPPDWLIHQLVDGMLDLAVLYAPQGRPGLVVEKLVDETLVLVASRPDHDGVAATDYVFVDWGEEFAGDHGLAFPDAATPGLSFSLGSVALDYLLERGGAGYFPLRLVRPHLDAGALHRLEAPTFSRPAYVMYRRSDSALLGTALAGLRQAAATET